jgi:hypothetical protein
MNKSYILDSPFYLFFRKHLCFHCGQILGVRKVSKIVNKKSPEAKEFDFSFGDSYFFGDVEFFYHMFYCDNCNNYYSIKEIKNNEKYLKKLKRTQSKMLMTCKCLTSEINKEQPQ